MKKYRNVEELTKFVHAKDLSYYWKSSYMKQLNECLLSKLVNIVEIFLSKFKDI